MDTPANNTLTFALYHYFPHGGLQRDCLKTVLACQALGYAVTVCTTQWEGEQPEGLTVHQLSVTGTSNHRRIVNFQKAVLAAKAPDSLLIGFNKIAGLDVYFASDTCYREKALTERGCLYRFMPRYKVYEQLERAVFAAPSTTHTLVLTQRQKDDFQTHYQTPDERFTLLPPGIAKNRFIENRRSIRARIRASLKLKEDQLLLLLVGSSFKTKGLDRAIQALAALPHDQQKRVSLVIAGGGKPDAYQQQAEKLGVSHALVFLGPRDDIQQLMVAADVLVHPARTESAGMVLVEALAAGLPIVVTGNCGYASHVDQADAGIVLPEPYQQKQLDTALQMMLDANSLLYWQQQALNYAANTDLYSLHQQAAKLIDQLYQSQHS